MHWFQVSYSTTKITRIADSAVLKDNVRRLPILTHEGNADSVKIIKAFFCYEKQDFVYKRKEIDVLKRIHKNKLYLK